MKRRKKHLIHVHQRILLEIVFARNKSASRPPVFLLVMLGYSSTIPETEKTTVQNAHYAYLKKLEVMSKNGFQIWIQHLKLGKNGYFCACLNFFVNQCYRPLMKPKNHSNNCNEEENIAMSTSSSKSVHWRQEKCLIDWWVTKWAALWKWPKTLSKTEFWKSYDDSSTKSKTSFISNDEGMFSFNKIMPLAMYIVQQKVSFSQKEWKGSSNSTDLNITENLWVSVKKPP